MHFFLFLFIYLSFHSGKNSVQPTSYLFRMSHIRNSVRRTSHLLRMSHIWNSIRRHPTFSGCLTSGILSDRSPTFSGCLTSGILSADVPPFPDVSHPEFCSADIPPSLDISHPTPDAGWEREAIQLPPSDMSGSSFYSFLFLNHFKASYLSSLEFLRSPKSPISNKILLSSFFLASIFTPPLF